jgi:hypothetical protein
MAQIPFEVPAELKERVRERLKSGNALKTIALRIKVGMGAAIGELRGQTGAKSIFDEPDFPRNDSDNEEAIGLEKQALQTVYQYLEARELKWTLGCLQQETKVGKEAAAHDLLALLTPDEEEPADGDGSDAGDIEEDEIGEEEEQSEQEEEAP